mmetsp:Transcript_11511/g.17350  ORF Transcript_11511/g.17350 Transcript_11511/m.17350 type:complete len:84 (-) Transcript_11511:985-1236(-)|eukprot:CAMPEP_0170482318 /NCGR_PEP_ID=MMETSP0208-20121228/2391_1 /TAXON_ID=197538 /ORGANISM="Strombidium inclinatum, Strain S3" /LENGTH=83 /DNA_ID=CAMNT_0010755145 /DNA_START=994 /DNA_END=1245 /DNA_ORIENTATION=+
MTQAQHSISNLREDVDEHKTAIEEILKEIEFLKKTMGAGGPNDEEFKLLKSRVEKLEGIMVNLRKAIGDLEKKMKLAKPGGAD